MVNNCSKILDEGQIKNIDHYKMPKYNMMKLAKRYQSDYIDSLDLRLDDRLPNLMDVATLYDGMTIDHYLLKFYNIKPYKDCWML